MSAPLPPEGAPTAEEAPVCYRHPEREAYIRCGRCERRICPDCMVSAAVGYQCPECVAEGHRGARTPRTLFGGRVRDDSGWVTKTLVGLTVLVFLWQQADPALVARFGQIGAWPPPPLEPQLGLADGEYYRLLTAGLLHAGLLHLVLNMYALWIFGSELEAVLGRWRFLALYVVSVLGGSAASYFFAAPTQASIGASGGVFGLLGAYLVVAKRLRRDTTPVLVLLAINLAYGFVAARIDWRAHLGGLVAGALIAAVMAYAPRRGRLLVQVVGVALVVLVALVVVAVRTAQLRA